MELCTAQALSKPPLTSTLFTVNSNPLRWRSSIPLKHSSSISPRTKLGLLYCSNPSLRSTTSEETSSGASQYVKEGPESVIYVEDVQSVDKNEYGQAEVSQEESSTDTLKQLSEFLEKLDIKFDSEDSYSLLLFGGGTLVALYLATAIIGAIDSIPVLPKLLELVGLGYAVWFSTRYLLFKENREELAAKIQDTKQQVLGPSDD